MVVSKIDENVRYYETKRVDKNDLGKAFNLYLNELNLNNENINVIITIGSQKDNFFDKNIYYFPIYLVKKNNKVFQIGVYEINSSNLLEYLDENGDLIIENLEPLLYSFVNIDLIKNLRKIPDEEIEKEDEEIEKEDEEIEKEDEEIEKEDEKQKKKTKKRKEIEEKNKKIEEIEEKEEILEIPDIRKSIFTLRIGAKIPSPLFLENKQQAERLRKNFQQLDTNTWVENFMSNNNYSIIDNEGSGDCLFATIRDAFDTIGQETQVIKIRNMLSNEVDEALFQNYKKHYNMFYDEIQNVTQQSIKIKKDYDSLKEKLNEISDAEQKRKVYKLATKLKEEYNRLKSEINNAKILMNEFKFMKNIKDINAFKDFVRTCAFWADTWAISTLERILNIKFIILSSRIYNEGDMNGVLQCGDLIDPIIEARGSFEPEYYIIIEHTGDHYKLIGYKNKYIFKFNEIPYDIKSMIINKCLERNSGIFNLIDNFRNFKIQEFGIETERPEFDELGESKLLNLYDDNIVFAFYSKSASKQLPGKGTGEKIPDDRILEFSQLADIKDWRRKLSNMWIQEFSLDNHKWASVEHYFQASKFKVNNPEFYLSFSLDSGTELSKNPEMAKGAGSKSGKHKGELLRPKQVKIIEDFETKYADKNIYDAQYAKFSQNEDLKNMLLLTKNAKLVHYVKGKEPETFDNLMIIRDKLSKGE